MPTPNLPEYRHLRASSLNIPSSPGHSNGIMSPMAGGQRFDGPRSPPNTSHVPCKFFKQGTCQAGPACPFSHELRSVENNICKYFSKGNCKFGAKCANIHMLSNGSVITYHKNGQHSIGAAPGVILGGRVNPTTYLPSPTSALTNSFMNAEGGAPFPVTGGFGANGDRYSHALGRQPSLDMSLQNMDNPTYPSNPTSAYGSPRDDEHSRFGMSPMNKVPGVMDVPLPASFDTKAIPNARFSPWPSSVPSKFGLESPSPSLRGAKDERTSETLKLLRTSAFGSSEHLPPSTMPADGAMMGSSPLAAPLGGGNMDEYFGKRATMHSSSTRFAKPRLMSSSASKADLLNPLDRDWPADFEYEADHFVPGVLADELLTPQERARRPGGSARDSDALSDSHPSSTPKFGSSPLGGAAGSPGGGNRWGAFSNSYLPRQRGDDDDGSLAKAMKGSSPFGHVGSPLRNSSLPMDGALLGSPGRNGRSGAESMSMLTQQLQRSRLDDAAATATTTSSTGSPHLHPSAAAARSGPPAGPVGRERDRALERHVSSGSVGSATAGRFPTPIDEEDAAFVFSMEEEDEAAQHHRALKRKSGGLGGGAGAAAGSFATYAGIAAGKDGGGVPTPKGRDGAGGLSAVGAR